MLAIVCDRLLFPNIISNIFWGTFALFVILFWIGNYVGKTKARYIISCISKYSYGMILFHHVIINKLLAYLGYEWFVGTKRWMTMLIICSISFVLSFLLSKVIKIITISKKH